MKALACQAPTPSVFALLQFGVLYHAEVMPLAYFIGQIKQLFPRPFLFAPLIFMGFKGLVIVHITIIENNVQMHMGFINMDGEEILILAFEKLCAKFLSDFQSTFGSNFPRLEALHEML